MAVNVGNNAGTSNTRKKAVGFINFAIPRKDGTMKNMPSMFLYADNDEEVKQLNAWLEEDPTRVKLLMEKFVVTYRPAQTEHKGGLDLE